MNFMRVPGGGLGDWEEPVLLLVFLLIAFLVFLIEKASRQRRRRWTRGKRPWAPRNPGNASDPANQMEFVSRVGFETRPLLNKEEIRVFAVLDETVGRIGGGLRVMAQTSLGEVLQPKGGVSKQAREQAFASINSKRLDFAVFSADGRLVLAVEYQGSGHYHHKSFMRDAVKKEALRKAGVPFLEVTKGSAPEELRERVRRILSPVATVGAVGAVGAVGPAEGIAGPDPG